MKRALLKIATNLGVLILLAAPAYWLAKGSHTGWTQTSVTRMEVDPITELEFPVVEDRFLPGVDFLAVAVVAGGAMAGVGLFFGRRRSPSSTAAPPG